MAPTNPQVVLHRSDVAKGWLATFAVIVVMVGIIGVGAAAAAAVANVPAKPIEVGSGVIVTIPPAWEFYGRSDDGTQIGLTRGSAFVVISVNQGTDVAATMKQLHDDAAATSSVAVGDIVSVTDVRGGAPGILRFAYSGTPPDSHNAGPVEGEVTGVAGTSVNVTFDGWAPKGNLFAVRGDILSIINTTTIP